MNNNLLTDQLTYSGSSQTATQLHLCSYTPTGVTENTSATFAPLQSALNGSAVNFLQVKGLQNTAEIEDVCTHFGLDFLVSQDILNVKHPTKIEDSDKYILLILKVFRFSEEKEDIDQELEQQQLCLILGNNFVLAFMEHDTDFFDDVLVAIRSNILKIRHKQADYLFGVLLNSVMGNYRTILSTISDSLEELEDILFTTHTGNDVGVQIQMRRRQYLRMKKTASPLKEQYGKLLRLDHGLLHKSNKVYFNDVNDHLQYVLQSIEICKESLSSLMDLYISNNDLRMNDIMKRLTVVSTIFIPLTFLVGIWGMNFKFMPELDWKYGYLAAWSIMLLVGVAGYFFIRRKKWY